MPHLLKVSTEALKLGMYVSQLDRPWLETNFLFEGFRIGNLSDIDMLRENCRYVYVDVEKGEWPDQYELNHTIAVPDAIELPKRRMTYEDETDVRQEMPDAEGSYFALSKAVRDIMEDVKAGKTINLKGIAGTVEDMIASVKRNPDALMWLTKLKQADNYTYTHAINCAVLAVAFGRHLGMAAGDLRDIAYGTLLYDIGKMRLPQGLLVKPGRLTDEEFQLLKSHVDHSVALMQQTKGVSAGAIDLALTHHERFDGSGYPKRLYGQNIPVFGRMAAIVDCYEAVITDRPYARAISSQEAIRKIYEWRGIDFQEELVEQFIQCLGVYPTGTLVELSSGEVGVVYGQIRIRRLRPKVMLILNQEKVAYGCFPLVDLMEQTCDAAGQPLGIARSLEPGAYGIDTNGLFLSNDVRSDDAKARA
jgi:HD-GYP domain-containing protein (c-di-GMP phosphodiesterase class II)